MSLVTIISPSLFLLLLFSLQPQCDAQESKPGAAEDDSTARAQQLYKEFLSTAESCTPVEAKDQTKFQLQATPLLSFSVDGKFFGSVFMWHDHGGQPAMIGTIGSIQLNNVDTEFTELHLLKPVAIQPLTVTGLPTKIWTPDYQQLKPRRIPNAPAVAKSERTRLVQMKSMIRQFAGQMVQSKQTHQLRLLPQPLYRLNGSSPEKDTALFAMIFDQGTDPEILISIQTVEVDGSPVWHFQPVRFSWRELTLQHLQNDVWHVDEFIERERPRQVTPYLTGLTRYLP